MRIDTIRLHQYRNYEDETIAFPAGTILLYGANGQGKTNLLESLYLAGIGKSYRGLSDGDLIRWGESEGSSSVPSMRYCSRRTTCSSSRAVRPLGGASWIWKYPRSARRIIRIS